MGAAPRRVPAPPKSAAHAAVAEWSPPQGPVPQRGSRRSRGARLRRGLAGAAGGQRASTVRGMHGGSALAGTCLGSKQGCQRGERNLLFPACILFLEEGEGRVLDH